MPMLAKRLRAALSDANRPTAISILAPLVMFAIFLVPSLLGNQVFAGKDLLEQQAPWWNSSQESAVLNLCVSDTIDAAYPGFAAAHLRIDGGDGLPMWDSSTSSGQPYAASFSESSFSPITATAQLVPVSQAPAVIKLLELIAIFAGMGLWLRRAGLQLSSAMLAATVFSTSGFMVVWTNWPQTRTAAFFPLVFWGVERIVQSRTWRSAWPLPLAIGSMILGGFVAIAFHCLYAAIAYAIVRLIASAPNRAALRTKLTLKPLAIGAVAVAIGIGITAFQLLAFQQVLGEVDLGYREEGWTRVISPLQVVTTAYSLGLGACGHFIPSWAGMHPNEGNFFIGAAALVLALVAVTHRNARQLVRGFKGFIVFGALYVVALLFVGGPFSYVVHFLPLMDSSPMPRIRALGGLFFAVLAAIGYDALLTRSPSIQGWVARALRIATPVVIVASGLLVLRGTLVLGTTRVVIVMLVVTVCSALTAWLASVWTPRASEFIHKTLLALVVVGVALEGWIFAAAFWPRVDGELFRETDTTTYLAEGDDVSRIMPVDATLWGGVGQAYGITSLTGHTFVTETWRTLLLEVDPTAFESPTNHRIHNTETVEHPLLDRLAISHVVLPLRNQPIGDIAAFDSTPILSDGVWNGEALTFTVGGGRLRGIALGLADQLSPPATYSAVTIEATDGEKVVSTSVRVGRQKVLFLPLAAEDFASSDTITITVTHDAPQPIELNVDSTEHIKGFSIWGHDSLVLERAVDAQIYVRPTALERVRWASTAAAYTDTDSFLTEVRTLAPETVLLPAADMAGLSMSGASAAIVASDPNSDEITVNVSAEGAGMVVFADAERPQWKAYVDGLEVPVHVVDYALMGVAVPEGEHEILLVFRSDGWSWEVYVAGALVTGILVFAGLDALTRIRRRRLSD